MFCARTACQTPVVAKTGYVYERRLLEKYIDETSADPVTGEPLTRADIVSLRSTPSVSTNKFVPPRLTAHTSIPALLQVLQSEWDAVMLEAHVVKSQNAELRQELSRALYQHDAACRVIARLLKEADELRQLASRARAEPPRRNGQDTVDSTMQVDGAVVPSDRLSQQVVADMEATAASLSATRRKRKAPPTLLPKSAFTDASFTTHKQSALAHGASNATTGISVVRMMGGDQNNGPLVVMGGNDKNVSVYDKDTNQKLSVLKGHTKRVTDITVVEHGPAAEEGILIITASEDTHIRIYRRLGEKEFECIHTFQLEHEVTSLTLHPSHKYLIAAAGNLWTLYNLLDRTVITQKSNSEPISIVQFHPDGLIMATGSAANESENTSAIVRIWQIASLETVANFEVNGNGGIGCIDFSENGYYMSASTHTTNSAKVFDLRKLSVASEIQLGNDSNNTNHVGCIRFDYSGAYLAIAVDNTIQIYANKTWARLTIIETDLSSSVSSLAWGVDAKYLLVAGIKDRKLRVIQSQMDNQPDNE